ncbi:uncharacterized protein SPPG_09340 [Spizellomyces punctatus DAOM BR117]|uniref:Uncharacterized protein n=1 Tax=Spizellomyces punctatus (strain DAOM BR117) TaxID=645134 RepID=A0A0L0HC07_SPIPD|nr:uncharacterized protein SPPG_09340 [Spizellomyces punctatus DAOM BR117]KNC99065.1 hypothetical protein SPPG_09340 [Spizellomyces punctatus DAOM BR117]|eukprot:XP_016607105.1 hypothetical protein SPPG_09340 [Spizellomyces punctatus DAOM BR117]
MPQPPLHPLFPTNPLQTRHLPSAHTILPTQPCKHKTPVTGSNPTLCRLCRVEGLLKSVACKVSERKVYGPIKYVAPSVQDCERPSPSFSALRNQLVTVSCHCASLKPAGVDKVRRELDCGLVAWDDVGREVRHWMRYHD